MMHPTNRSKTGVLASLTIVFFLALIIILEGLAHLPVVQNISPFKSVGNYHYQFELKWFQLQKYVEEKGGVDIIFVGSSLVNTGVDPEIVAKVYKDKTGFQARIFNFGVEGLTVSPNSLLISILEQQYHPALIVFVTEMRDYIACNGLETETYFLSNSWIRYKLGEFAPFGWLINNSAFLQLYLPYRSWMRSDFPETMAALETRFYDMSSSGYEPDTYIGKNIMDHPDPGDPDDALNFQQFGNFQIDLTRQQDLVNILEVGKATLHPPDILIVEMPIHPNFYDFVGGDQVHREFQQAISSIVSSKDGYFLSSQTCLSAIPLQGRSNLWHLNYLGAPFFSDCLGENLATLALQHNTDFIKEMEPGGEIP
jgi:hypothetical protein